MMPEERASAGQGAEGATGRGARRAGSHEAGGSKACSKAEGSGRVTGRQRKVRMHGSAPVGVEWSVDEILRAREPRKRQVTE